MDIAHTTPPLYTKNNISDKITEKSEHDDKEDVSAVSVSESVVPRPYKGELAILSTGMFQRWKDRYIVLEIGVLQCYEVSHWEMHNVNALHDYTINENPNDAIDVIRLKSSRFPDICLRVKSSDLREKWIRRFSMHLAFANFQYRHNRTQYLKAIKPYVNKSFRFSSRHDKLIDVEQEFDQTVSNQWHFFGYFNSTTPQKESRSGQSLYESSDSEKIVHTIHDKSVQASVSHNDQQFNTNSNNPNNTPLNKQRKETFLQYHERLRRIEPPVLIGWLHKLGRFVPSIRHRLFILEQGVLSYYGGDVSELGVIEYLDHHDLNGNTIDNNSHHNNDSNNSVYYREEFIDRSKIVDYKQQVQNSRNFTLKGSLRVTNYEIYTKYDEGHIKLTLLPGVSVKLKRKLVLYFDDFVQRERWVKALNFHIDYKPN